MIAVTTTHSLLLLSYSLMRIQLTSQLAYKGLSLLIISNMFCLGHLHSFKPERLTLVRCFVIGLVHVFYQRSIPYLVWCVIHFHHCTLDDSYEVSMYLSYPCITFLATVPHVTRGLHHIVSICLAPKDYSLSTDG